jgi:hypothetical protein
MALADAASIEQGRRLQQFLEDATGFQAIAIVDDGLPPARLLQVNAGVGRLWRWFLNEVALTEKTWQAYRVLRGR